MILPWVLALVFLVGVCLAIGPQGEGRTVLGWVLAVGGGVWFLAITGWDGFIVLAVIIAFLAPLGLAIHLMADTAQRP